MSNCGSRPKGSDVPRPGLFRAGERPEDSPVRESMRVPVIVVAAALIGVVPVASADDGSNATGAGDDRALRAVVQSHGMPDSRAGGAERQSGQDAGRADRRGGAALAPTAWLDAAKSIVKGSPADNPQLPEPVRRALTARGCVIPQPDFFFDGTVNVISGNFAGNPAPDHAVLCSVGGVSHIHIVWGGPNGCEPEIEARDDSYALQTVEPERIGYSRLIAATVSPYPGEGHGAPSEQTGASEMVHGIEDIFIEKASTRFYCVQGQWRELPGAD